MTRRLSLITIRIQANKNGKRVAHYWGAARRWLPMKLDVAELALATGKWGAYDAAPLASTADPLPVGYVHTSHEGDVFSV